MAVQEGTDSSFHGGVVWLINRLATSLQNSVRPCAAASVCQACGQLHKVKDLVVCKASVAVRGIAISVHRAFKLAPLGCCS